MDYHLYLKFILHLTSQVEKTNITAILHYPISKKKKNRKKEKLENKTRIRLKSMTSQTD